MKKYAIQTIITGFILITVTTVLFLYTSGYRIGREDKVIDIKRTGMIGAKSIPEGANVYIDDELSTATNGTIQGLNPGTYTLRIEKHGFIPWSKEVEVFKELVTDITAVLISQTPRLEPLTNTGAMFPTISPSFDKIAFFTKDEESPGIWIIPLDRQGISLFRSNPFFVIEDAPNVVFSDGFDIQWSPNEKQLLVQLAEEQFYIVDINSSTAETTTSIELTKESWNEQIIDKRIAFISKLNIPEQLVEIATNPETMWSPDGKKFVYTVQNQNELELKVYNLEKPLPIGEKVETTVFTQSVDTPMPQISWYSDSYHLVLVENFDPIAQKGAISLIRLDGTNKTLLYNNSLMFDKAYSAPGGDKIIILTSLKSGEQSDLYTIGIR